MTAIDESASTLVTSTYSLIVYGGAFDPPHKGHADVVEQLSCTGQTILLVPSFRHAHGKDMSPFEVRCELLEKMVKRLREKGINVRVDRIEQDLAQQGDGPVYSWLLLNAIAQREGLNGKQIGFVIGEDNMSVLPRFHKAVDLINTFGLVVAREQVKLHSSDIRRHMATGFDPNPEWLAPGLDTTDIRFYGMNH